MPDALPVYLISTGLRYLAVFVFIVGWNSSAPAQTVDSFDPLFDGETLEGWVVENSAGDNFYVKDGILRVEGPEGWLRTVRHYGDFILRAEFRFLTDNADSGIFVRVAGDRPFARGWPGGSYQVQTRDVSKNRTTRPRLIGDIYRHLMPEGETMYDADAAFDAFRLTGEWQTFEITALADSLTVALNGSLITRASDVAHPEGYIGLQGETGIVEFRSIEISER